MARYGALERLHDVLVSSDFVDQLWQDDGRPPGDHDMTWPWMQALYRVRVSYVGPVERYELPELLGTHWMPELWAIEEYGTPS